MSKIIQLSQPHLYTSAAAAELLLFSEKDKLSGYSKIKEEDLQDLEVLNTKVVRAGVGFRVGKGKSIDLGVLKGEASISIFGVLEGAATLGGKETLSLYRFTGEVGVLGLISAKLDFIVLKAEAEVRAYAAVGFELRQILAQRDSNKENGYLSMPPRVYLVIGIYLRFVLWASLYPLSQFQAKENFIDRHGVVQVAKIDELKSGQDEGIKRNSDSHSHYYRTSIRYASVSLYEQLNKSFFVRPYFRDIYGNRIPSSQDQIQYDLHYTDRLIPISEWPGVSVGVHSLDDKQLVLKFLIEEQGGDQKITEDDIYIEDREDADKTLSELGLTTEELGIFDYITYDVSSSDLQKIKSTLKSPEKVKEQVNRINQLIEGESLYTTELHKVLSLDQVYIESEEYRHNKLTRLGLNALNREIVEKTLRKSGIYLRPRPNNQDSSRGEQYERLLLIREQLVGVEEEDVTVSFAIGGHGIDEPVLFSNKPLKGKLISWLDSIIKKQQSLEKEEREYTFELDTAIFPEVFSLEPIIIVKRSKNLPPKDLVNNNSTLSGIILETVSEAKSVVSLVAGKSESNELTKVDGDFKKIA